MKKQSIHFLAKASSAMLVAALCLGLTGCGKSNDNPGNNDDNGGVTGTNHVDQSLVGKWMWTDGSDGAYYDENGTYSGSAYGFAMEYTIKADGTGKMFNHIFSSLDGMGGLEVNISYNGYFESDDSGKLTFYPVNGTYKNNNGVDRSLNPDEVWDASANSGRKFEYSKAVQTTDAGKQCMQVTFPSGETDDFFIVQ